VEFPGGTLWDHPGQKIQGDAWWQIRTPDDFLLQQSPIFHYLLPCKLVRVVLSGWAMSELIQVSEQAIAWLTVRLTPGMTRGRFHSLMKHFRTAENALGAAAQHIAAVKGFDDALARDVASGSAAEAAEHELEACRRWGVRLVTWDDPDYPYNLRDSDLAPPLLYVRGTLVPNDRCSVAMVGSRHATQYGRTVARDMSAALAAAGLTVVSGFARGIDSESHIAALRAGGRTIAVLGCGVDVNYPAENQPLTPRIIESGAIISEYPLTTSPDRYNFPERNHVIAALSLGTVVVEAGEKSGARITARLAAEENRFVFAVPGDVMRANSRGANRLIQDGARLAQSARDVMVEMRHQLRGYVNEELLVDDVEEKSSPKSGKSSRGEKMGERENEAESEQAARTETQAESAAIPRPVSDVQQSKNPVADGAFHPGGELQSESEAPGPKIPGHSRNLKPEEVFVAEIICHEPAHFDVLAARCSEGGITIQRLSTILLALELKGCIRQMPGRVYAAGI